MAQVSWGAMVQAANVSQMLQNSGNLFTVFAPANSAIQVAIENNLIMCQAEDYLDQLCTSLQALFNSTSLPQLVLNNSKLQKLYTTLEATFTGLGMRCEQLARLPSHIAIRLCCCLHVMCFQFFCSCARSVGVYKPHKWHVAADAWRCRLTGQYTYDHGTVMVCTVTVQRC